MTLVRNFTTALAAVTLSALASLAHAQAWPTKPVKVITPFPPGSGPDAVMRLVADKLAKSWGQPVTIENRPGGNGFIALGAAKGAAPDGYTLAQASSSQIVTHPLIYRKMPYDPSKDFVAVTPLFRNYFFVVVPAAAPWKTAGDLIAAAKAQPGRVTYGSEFVGSPGHLGSAALEAASGTQMTHIPFKETSQLFAAVGSGDVNWAFGSAGTAGPAVRSGKARLLAVAAPSRVAGYTDVPTIAESGGPAGFDLQAWTVVLAPTGTPAALVARIQQDVQKALAEPDMKERFTAFGYELFPLTPADTAKQVQVEQARFGETIKRLNLSLD